MKTRRNRSRNKKKHSKTTKKKWVTAIDAAQKTLTKTGDLEAARKSLRKQALYNARRLFGSVSSSM